MNETRRQVLETKIASAKTPHFMSTVRATVSLHKDYLLDIEESHWNDAPECIIDTMLESLDDNDVIAIAEAL